jgi:hypothetical protein
MVQGGIILTGRGLLIEIDTTEQEYLFGQIRLQSWAASAIP